MSQTNLKDPQEKLLLVALAHFLNESTRQCNPSRETLMRAACISNSNTLTKKIRSLEEKGLISVIAGKGCSNNYLLHEGSTFTDEVPSRMKHLHTCSTTTFTHEAPPPSYMKHEQRIEQGIEQGILINNNQVASSNSKKPPSITGEEKPTCTKTEQVAEDSTISNSEKVQSGEDFCLTSEPEDKAEKPPKKPKTKAITFKFNFKELPDSWRKYCEERRPDIDPLQLFVDFEFYYTQCEGKDTYYSEKGWAQCWQGWVRRNFQQKPNQFLKNSSYRAAGTASNGAPIKYDKNGIRQSGFDAAYYAEDDEDV